MVSAGYEARIGEEADDTWWFVGKILSLTTVVQIRGHSDQHITHVTWEFLLLLPVSFLPVFITKPGEAIWPVVKKQH